MLISPVFASATPDSGLAFQLMNLLPLIVIGLLFYFVMLRPQQKKMLAHKAMLASIAKGDEVITSGGLLARVTKVGEAYLTLEVADQIEIIIERSAVNSKLEKGTIKAQR